MTNKISVRLNAINAVSHAPYTVNMIDGSTTDYIDANSPLVSHLRFPNDNNRYKGMSVAGGIPYISGSSFKSKLRAHATEIVTGFSKLKGDSRFSYNDLFTLLKGGKMITVSKEIPTDPFKTTQEVRDASPVMSLFGGAYPVMSPASVSIGNMYVSDVENTRIVNIGQVRHDIARDCSESVSDYEAAIGQKFKTALENEEKKKKKAELSKEKKTATDARKEEIEVALNLLKEEKTDVNNQHLLDFWAIPPKTEFEQTIYANGILERDFALLVLAMQKFTETPLLGARAGSSGCGADLKDIDWEITIDGEDHGTILNPSQYVLDMIVEFKKQRDQGDFRKSLTEIVQAGKKPEPKAKK